MARLPKNVKPTHYDLDLHLDLEDLAFQGSVVVHLDVIHEAASVVLHSNDLEITGTKIVNSSGEATLVPAVQSDPDQKTITVPLGKPMAAGSQVQLHLSFRGTIKPSGETAGLQWTSYKTDGADHGTTASDGPPKRVYSTMCEPVGARCIFPCLDEPAYKATLASAVTVNQDLTCVSNMDIVSTSSQVTAAGAFLSKRVVFRTTPPMATYLVCFVVGDLDCIEEPSPSSPSPPSSPSLPQLAFPVRLYAVRGTDMQRGAGMLAVAVQALRLYEDMFGLAYPLPKLDLVALPDHGGLENWGCIVFGERYMLLDRATTATKTWQTAVETLCHELAHQWFGNLVTMAWWDDLWLNEAFAEWAGFTVVDRLFPAWQYWLHFVAGDPDPEAMAFYQGALDVDATRASHPIYNPTASPDRMGELFDNITYMKGASILRMLCQSLGTETFLAGIQGYLKSHVYANATREDLWAALTAASSHKGRDVKQLMQAWTERVGYPVVAVSEDAGPTGAGSLTLVQHRYLQSAKVAPEDDETLYCVPLNWLLQRGNKEDAATVPEVDRSVLLAARQQTYPVDDLAFYKLNAQQIGLYRVAYPASRLRTFAQQLSANRQRLSPEDRVGLLADAHAFASSSFFSSYSSTAGLLGLLWTGFQGEDNFLVWRQIFYALAKVRQAFLFSSPETSAALQRFHRHLILPRCTRGDDALAIQPGDPVEVQSEKALFFSQAVAYDDLGVQVAKELFDDFMAGRQEHGLHPDIRKYVFQAVARDSDCYDAMLALARQTRDPEIRTDAFVALGYADSPARVQQSLAFVTKTDEPFSGLEKWFLLNALQTHRAGAAASWHWLRTHWADFGQVHMVTMARHTASCTSSLSTAAQLQDVQAFASTLDEKYKTIFEEAVQGIQARMSWVERDRQGVEAWLKEHDLF